MPIDVDPMSYTFDTGWDKRGRETGYLVNTILNKNGMRDDVLNVIDRWNGNVENEIRAKELMVKLFESIEINVDNTPNEGEWYEWEEKQVKYLDHFWALGVILYYMLCGRPSVDGDTDKEEFCQNVNLGMTRESDIHKNNNEKLDKWGRLRTSAKNLIKDFTHFNPGNRPLYFDLGWWGCEMEDEKERAASDSWSEWLVEENREKRKASNHHKREDSHPRKQPRLTEEWTEFFSTARKLSKKKKKKIRKLGKQKENEERFRIEEDIKEWHRLYYKRNDSTEDYEEFNEAAINPPPGAWETLDSARIRLCHNSPGPGD